MTKEAVDFFVKAFAAHNRRVDEAMLSQALKPIFKDKERTMIKTIFDEKYEAGVAEGRAEGEANAIIRTLTKRFKSVPNELQAKLLAMINLEQLDKLANFAFDCQTLAEFEQALK